MTNVEMWAENILNAAGSSLKHYTPYSKDRVINAVLLAAAGARNDALEEAANICDTTTGLRYAEQIRALKTKA
jgi:hypothetical protein